MMRFLFVLGIVFLWGCSNHSVEPGQDYNTPSKIPRVDNVIVIPGPGGSFDVTWEYDDSIFKIVDGFYVERATFLGDSVSGEFVRLNEVLIQRREYEDRSGLPEGKYVFRVISVTPAGIISDPSNWVTGVVDTNPPSPPILAAEVVVSLGQQIVELTWTASDEDVVFYRLYRSPSFGLIVFVDQLPDQHFSDAAVLPETVYHYWVTAIDGGLNESVNSNVESVQIDF